MTFFRDQQNRFSHMHRQGFGATPGIAALTDAGERLPRGQRELAQQLAMYPGNDPLRGFMGLRHVYTNTEDIDLKNSLVQNTPEPEFLFAEPPSITLGTTAWEEAVTSPTDDFNKPWILQGDQGRGKSTVVNDIVRQIIRSDPEAVVLMTDPKSTAHRRHATDEAAKAASVIDATKFAMAFGDPQVEGISEDDARAAVVESLRGAAKRARAHEVADTVLKVLLRACPPGVYPPLKTFYSWVAEHPAKDHRARDLKGGILGPLESLGTSMGDSLENLRCGLIRELLSTPGLHIIQRGSAPLWVLSFVLGMLIGFAQLFARRIFEYRERRVIFVVEDATQLAHAQQSRETFGGMTQIDELACTGRELNNGLILVTHSLSATSPLVVDNAHVIISTGAFREDDRIAAQKLNLNSRELADSKLLGPLVFLASSPRWGRTFAFKPLPMSELPYTAEAATAQKTKTEQLYARAEIVPAAKHWLPAPKPSSPSKASKRQSSRSDSAPSSELPKNPHRMMALLAEQLVDPFVTYLQARSGLTAKRASQAIKTLADQGLIEYASRPTGGRGAPLRQVLLTQQGEAYLAAHQIQCVSRPRIGGDRGHDSIVIARGHLAVREGWVTEYAPKVGDVIPDLVCRKPGGGVLVVECGMSSAEREVHHLVHHARTFTRKKFQLELICRDKAFVDRVRQLLAAHSEFEESMPTLQLCGTVLQSYFKNQQPRRTQ